MATTLDGNRLKEVKVSGKTMNKQLTEACIGASLSSSKSSITELELSFQDSPDAHIFRGGGLKEGTVVRYGAWRTKIDSVEIGPGDGGPVIKVKAPSLGVSRLKDAVGPKNWGKVDTSAWVEQQAKAAGMTPLVQPGLGKRETMRQQPDGDGSAERESTWDVMGDLAKEVGVWLFEYGGYLVFAKPSWLNKRPGRRHLSLAWDDWSSYSAAMASMPRYKSDKSASVRETLTISLISADADAVRPGDTMSLGGRSVGRMGGDWIAVSVNFPLSRVDPVDVEYHRPNDPVPQPRKEPAAKKAKAGNTAGKISGSSAAPSALVTKVKAFARKYNGRALDWDHGYGAQCVDLAKAYNESVVGGPRLMGNGKDWVGNPKAKGAYTRLGAKSKARIGDIAGWGGSWGGGYGHVAIVLEDRGSKLYCISQSNGRTKYINLGKNGLQGYLRPKKW